jgi:hypothetical protein
MKTTSVSKTTSVLSLLLLFTGILPFLSCNQDDIFYQVENEIELRDPRVPGGPSTIVEYKDALYVATDGIWHYSLDSGHRWRKISGQPPGTKILDIAATKDYLYAVTSGLELSDSRYYRGAKGSTSGDITWTRIPRPSSHSSPNTLYGAGDTLFVGAAQSSNYAVYALKDGDSAFIGPIQPYSSGAGMLLGAAKWDGRYFISREDEGVFYIDSTNLAATSPPPSPVFITDSNSAGNFTGFIVVGDDDNALLMVSSNGVICKFSAGDALTITATNSNSLGFDFTGAIAVWYNPVSEAKYWEDVAAVGAGTAKRDNNDNNRLLLLGRKGSNISYSGYGYYEVPILDNFDVTIIGRIDPQITVEKNATYKSSLAKRAINSIYQVPNYIDASMPIFASTQGYNLWACRNREWNYE